MMVQGFYLPFPTLHSDATLTCGRLYFDRIKLLSPRRIYQGWVKERDAAVTLLESESIRRIVSAVQPEDILPQFAEDFLANIERDRSLYEGLEKSSMELYTEKIPWDMMRLLGYRADRRVVR